MGRAGVCIFGEGDGIPGLVADLYGTHLVVQVLTAGTERVVDHVLAALRERVADRIPSSRGTTRRCARSKG